MYEVIRHICLALIFRRAFSTWNTFPARLIIPHEYSSFIELHWSLCNFWVWAWACVSSFQPVKALREGESDMLGCSETCAAGLGATCLRVHSTEGVMHKDQGEKEVLSFFSPSPNYQFSCDLTAPLQNLTGRINPWWGRFKFSHLCTLFGIKKPVLLPVFFQFSIKNVNF